MFWLVFLPLSALLFVYSLCRVCFWLFNPSIFASLGWQQLYTAFAYGVLFDASILVVTHAPLLLMVLLIHATSAHWHRYLTRLITTYLIVVDVPLLLAAFGDVAYFPFTGRRSTFAALELGGDLFHQFAQLSMQYWYLWLIGVLCFALVAWSIWYSWALRDFRANWRLIPRFGFAVATLLAVVTVARGGWTEKPLAPAHAYALGDARVAAIALNTPFIALRALGRPTLQRRDFFADWQDVLRLVGEPPLRFVGQAHQGYNVVVILLESFAAEYSGLYGNQRTFMPFFDQLAREGLYFENSFANGRRSIDAMPAILAGIPAFMEDAYVRTQFATNELHAFSRVLAEAGYHTAFFHGGFNGTMFFDVFAKLAGIAEYYGFNEYPNKGDTDGDWGIFDEPFLQFAARQMSQFRQPFFAQIFTLTSHNPYPIPAKYRGVFPKGTLPIHESIGYADHALKEFFAYARQQSWFERTLFVLTGDHTSLSEDPRYQTSVGVHRVPIVFYAPGVHWNAKLREKTVQHLDIGVSVLDFVGVKPKRALLFGRSVFDADFAGRAFNREGGWYWLMEGTQVREFDGSEPLDTAAPDAMQQQWRQRAWLQYFTNGMLDNKLYVDIESVD